MTIFVLLRHAQSVANEQGVLAGRQTGVALSKNGRSQAKQIAKHYSDNSFDRILSSPLERCLETVDGLAHIVGKRVVVDEAFIEMNYGAWSGKPLKELSKKREWKQIQKYPSSFKFPKGESFLGAQRRVTKRLNELCTQYPNKVILIVSHGDIIKIAIQSALNGSLDDFQRIIVDPGSMSVIDWNVKGRSVLHINLPLGNSIKASLSRFGAKFRASRKVLGGGSGV